MRKKYLYVALRFTQLLVVFMLASTVCLGQVTSGTILGTVTDASGAVVPGAKVHVKNTGTNVVTDRTANADGDYEVPYLIYGQYEVLIEAPGFKTFRQTNINLNTDQKYRVDAKLQVGSSAQAITVSASAAVLQTDSSQLSGTIDSKTMLDLPNITHNPLYDAMLVAGVQNVGAFLDPQQVNNGSGGRQNFASYVVNGTQPLMGSIMLDGAADTNPNANEIAIVPNMESVGEIKVITNSYSAEYGRSAGGVIQLTTKSGTNAIHGSMYDFFRNNALNANSFGNNTFGRYPAGTPDAGQVERPRPPFSTNQFGTNISAPLVIPKLYDGHNKTFIFASYEGLRRVVGASTYYTVPTALEQAGNFSQTKSDVTVSGVATPEPVQVFMPEASLATVTQIAAGQYQIIRPQACSNNTYNPCTGTLNVIPSQYLDSVSTKAASYFPAANITPVNPDGTSNYFTNNPTWTRTDQASVKIDHNFSETKKAFFRWTTDWTYAQPPNIFATNPSASFNANTTQYNPSGTVGYDWTLSPNSVLELRANVTRVNLIVIPPGSGLNFNFANMGFSPTELVAIPFNTYPKLQDGSYAAEGAGANTSRSTVFTVTPNYTKLAGAWSFKIGGEYDAYLYDFDFPQYASMYFTTSPTTPSGSTGNTDVKTFTANCQGGTCPTVPTGDVNGWQSAGFALGAVDGIVSGQYTTGEPAEALKNGYWALYTQNDWRATKSLTVNLGLRWDYQGPLTERYNRLSEFNMTGINATGTAGAYIFPGVNGIPRGQTNTDASNFGPRIGFAYRLGKKMVIRSAYGISYQPITGVGSGGQGFGDDGWAIPDFVSIRPLTGAYAGLDILQNNYENAFSQGGVTGAPNPNSPVLLGKPSVTAVIRTDNKVPSVQQWNFTLQRQMPLSIDLTVAYVGTKGTHIGVQQAPINQPDDVPAATLNSALNTYVATGVNPMTSTVTNPFYGLISGNTSLDGPTITNLLLDEPYPAYGGVTRFQDRLGSSSYNGLQITARHTFQHGVMIQGIYTWAHSIDWGNGYTGQIMTGNSPGTFFWNWNDRALDRSPSGFDQTQRLVMAYDYNLPFGKGRAFATHTPVVTQVIGGWMVAGVTSFSSGFPLGWSGTGFGRPNLIGNCNLPKGLKWQTTNGGAYTMPTGQSYTPLSNYILDFNPYCVQADVLYVPKVGSPGTYQYVANPYYYGTAPRLQDDMRAQGMNDWEMSVQRTIDLTEKFKLNIRAEAYNAFNRVQMGAPASLGIGGPALTGTNIGYNTSTNVGVISASTIGNTVGASTSTPRYMELAMTIRW